MKIVVLIVRLLLGLVFFVFGLNAFCNSSRVLYPAASPDSFFRLYSSRTMGWRSRSAGGWRRAAADQSLCSAGADDSWAGNRKYFAPPSAAQSRRHRGRPDRGGVLACV